MYTNLQRPKKGTFQIRTKTVTNVVVLNAVVLTAVVPRCCAGQGLASGTVGDVGCDDGEDEPRGEEAPPVEFGCKVEGHHPHLKQRHQLQSQKAEATR